MRFIELYKTHKNLWDKQHQFFGKLFKRRNSITEISAELKISPDEVIKKMIRMKAKFRECWFRNQTTTWEYYTALNFLAKNFQNVVTEKQGSADNGEAVLDQFYVDEEDDLFIACGSNPKPPSEVTWIPWKTPVKKEASEPDQAATAPATPAAVAVAPTPTYDATAIDDFFRAMAAIVKGFPRKKVVEIRSKISELVNNMDLKLAIEQDTRVTTSETWPLSRISTIIIFRFFILHHFRETFSFSWN